MYKKTPHGLPTASQALTKHRNVLLEVNFSVEFEVFFGGKKVPLFFWVGRKSKDSLFLKTENILTEGFDEIDLFVWMSF